MRRNQKANLIDKVDPPVKKALENASKAAQELMAWKLPTIARVANGWLINTVTMGVYGNYYLKRAIVALQGLARIYQRMRFYPRNLGDEVGKPLDGANKYAIHFDKTTIPQGGPASVFRATFYLRRLTAATAAPSLL